jgi:hypothetical protein
MWESHAQTLAISQRISTHTDTPASQTRKVLVLVRSFRFDLKVLSNWTSHQQSSKKIGDKDFSALNKLALSQKATTPRK